MPELVNAVGGGDLEIELDLDQINRDLEAEEIRYDPEYWPGVHVRFKSRSPAVLIFRTGKYNIAGAESIEELFNTKNEFLKRLSQLGVEWRNSSFEIRNLVYMDRYGRELNLDNVTVALGFERAEYEPEQFPGIIYDTPKSSGTFLIFRTGKILFTGATDPDKVDIAFTQLYDEFDVMFSH